MHAINIGISEKDRGAIAVRPAGLLADICTLYLTTHNCHWNVTGPMFNTLHTMFMAQFTELWTAVDPIAERIRSLGHPGPRVVCRLRRSEFFPLPTRRATSRRPTCCPSV